MIFTNDNDRFWLEYISPVLHHHAYQGADTFPQGWIEPMRVIYNHQLVMVSSGDVSIEIEGKEFLCQESSFIIIPPDKRHISRNTSSGPSTRHWIHFDWIHQGNLIGGFPFSYIPGKVVPEYFHPAPDFVPQKILFGQIHSPAYVFELHNRICCRLNSPRQHEHFNCRGLLLDLLTSLLYPREEKVNTPDECLALRVKDKLDEMAFGHPHAKSGVQHYLKTLGRSYAHLCRLFHKTYGIPPLTYFNNLRIEKAKFLLQSTDLSIAEIADKTGFATPGYFSRKFRQHTTLSPREFRNDNSAASVSSQKS